MSHHTFVTLAFPTRALFLTRLTAWGTLEGDPGGMHSARVPKEARTP